MNNYYFKKTFSVNLQIILYTFAYKNKGVKRGRVSKVNKPNRKTVMTRIDEQTHRKLSAYKALYGCKTLSQAIDKLMEKKNELC